MISFVFEIKLLRIIVSLTLGIGYDTTQQVCLYSVSAYYSKSLSFNFKGREN